MVDSIPARRTIHEFRSSSYAVFPSSPGAAPAATGGSGRLLKGASSPNRLRR